MTAWTIPGRHVIRGLTEAPAPAESRCRLRRDGLDYSDLRELIRRSMPGGPRPTKPGEWASCTEAPLDG